VVGAEAVPGAVAASEAAVAVAVPPSWIPRTPPGQVAGGRAMLRSVMGGLTAVIGPRGCGRPYDPPDPDTRSTR
jgi:hypothetical protein